jgi:hypothetical protein
LAALVYAGLRRRSIAAAGGTPAERALSGAISRQVAITLWRRTQTADGREPRRGYHRGMAERCTRAKYPEVANSGLLGARHLGALCR